jgi:outer membrane protein OmpA-like peptidoglycan-associated protein
MRVLAQPALIVALSLLLASAAAAPPAGPRPAETDIQAMIEALMPAASRSMRNLVVRQKAEEAAVASSAPAAAAALASSAASAPDTVSAAVSAALVPASAAAPPPPPAAVAVAVPVATPGPPPSLALAIQFEPNSARVRPESGALLGSLVAAMQSPELKGSRFLIEGHADPRGGAAQNQRLSQERADEVRLYLVSLGVHPARLRAVGKGASQLADAGDPTAATNRRVRVVTLE